MIKQRALAHAAAVGLAASLVAGCAATPSKRRSVRADEPRVLRGARCGRYGGDEARDTVLHRRRPSADPAGDLQFLQQHRRFHLGDERRAAGRWRSLRQRHGPCDVQHRVGPRRLDRHRVDDRHRARQPGLRAHVRQVGLRPGPVPVRAAVRPDDVSRRRGLDHAALRRPDRVHRRRSGAQYDLLRSARSTFARR